MAPRGSGGATTAAGVGGSQYMLANTLQQAADKEEQYRAGINKNHVSAMVAAGRLIEVEEILSRLAKESQKNNNNGGDNEAESAAVITEAAVKSFVEKSQQRFVQLAEKNAENDRTVTNFVAAAHQLRVEAQQEQATAAAAAAQQQQDGSSLSQQDAPTATKDYGALLKEKIGEAAAQQQPNQQQPDFVRKIRNELGVENEADAEMGDDEDVMLMNNTLASQANNLKCPITQSLFVDPVKNKVCGHTYSREGILSYIQQSARTRKACRCPVAGCANSGILRQDQLESDTMMDSLVRRERRRQDQARQVRASQAASLDSDDDEDVL